MNRTIIQSRQWRQERRLARAEETRQLGKVRFGWSRFLRDRCESASAQEGRFSATRLHVFSPVHLDMADRSKL